MTDIEGEVVERMQDAFSSPYPVDDPDTEWNTLVEAISNQFEELESVRQNVEDAKFVEDATDEQLNKLATLFQLERRTGESNETFRTRIKAQLRAQLSSGTNEDIRSAAGALLNADTSVIDIVEPYQDEHPNINVVIPVDDFSAIQTPGDVWNDVLDTVAAAGVELRTLVDVGDFDVRVTYASASHEQIAEGDFAGVDYFDGQGAFGAEDADDTDHVTSLSFTVTVDFDAAASQDVFGGFGSSAFGAGDFDGSSDDEEVFGKTSGDGYSVTITYGNFTHTDLGGEPFTGLDAFDGQGAFGAGDSDDVYDTTLVSFDVHVDFDEAANQDVFQGFGSGAFGAGEFDGVADDSDVFGETSADAYSVTISYGNITHTDLGGEPFTGLDAFDGQGAFGAGNDDTVFSTTGITMSLALSYAAAANSTVFQGFGSGAFGAGQFDGSADDADVEHTTSADAYSVIVSFAAPSSTDVFAGFGSDAFDGTGAFGAGDATSPSGSTGVSMTVTVTFASAGNSTVYEGFGSGAFGAGSFDGSPDDADTESSTGIATSITVLWDSATSTTVDSDGFGAGVFDGTDTFD